MHFIHKAQKLDSYSQTKAALEQLWSSLKTPQLHGRIKNLRIITQKVKKDSLFAASHLPSQHCSAPATEVPLLSKKK